MSYRILAESCTGCTACLRVCPVNAILGEKKKPHAIITAICIDCGACGRICPYQAVLNPQGEVCEMLKRSLWPQPHVLEEKCISCGVCLEVCPTSVLDFAPLTDHRVRAVARLCDAPNCIGCAFCETACPVEAIAMQAGKKA